MGLYSNTSKEEFKHLIGVNIQSISNLNKCIEQEKRGANHVFRYNGNVERVGTGERVMFYERLIQSSKESIKLYKSFLMIDEAYLGKIKAHLLNPESWDILPDKMDLIKLTAEETRDKFIRHIKHLIELGWDMKNGFDLKFIDNKTLWKAPLIKDILNPKKPTE